MQSLFRTIKSNHIILLLLLCLRAPLLLGQTTCGFSIVPTDWQPTQDTHIVCGGYYEPFYPLIPNFNQSNQLPVSVDFHQGQAQWEGISELFQVKLEQGQRWLEARHMLLNRNGAHWDLLAQGPVVFHQPNTSVWADSAFYDNDTSYLRLMCGDFRWYPRHARAKGEFIEMFGQEKIVLHRSTFTTCPPTQDSWQLNAKKITLYPSQGRAQAKHLYLSSHGVPLFYWPYLNYPVDNQRHSGFLFPSYSSSSQSGISISVPYYFNLAPNYDLTVNMKAYSKRGAGLSSHFRYLTQHSHGAFSFDYLPNDTAYQQFKKEILQTIPDGYSVADPRILGLKNHSFRLGLGLNHHAAFRDTWQINLLYNRVSDDNFFVDLSNDIHATSTLHLPQRAELAYFGQNWQHLFRIEEYQVLQPFKGAIVEEVYRRQPEWAFGATYPGPITPLLFNLSGGWTYFTHPGSTFSDISKIEGARFHIQPALSLPLQATWGEFTPTVYLDFLTYHLKNPKDLSTPLNTHPNRFTPIYTFDSKLFFEKPLHFKGERLQQTLTPRVFYNYIPYRDQRTFPNFDSGRIQFSYAQLFRYNRFSGKDRLNEANQLSLSMTSSILSEETQFEWFRIGVGEIFYFTPERVMLCAPDSPKQLCDTLTTPRASRKHSNLLSEFVFATPNGWQWGSFIEWGLQDHLIEQASVFLQAKHQQGYLFNLNYYFAHQDIKQSQLLNDLGINQGDISVFLPLGPRWNALSRLQYDFKFDQVLELLGGVEYNSCCFATQFVLSRYRQLGNALLGRAYANQIMLQFVFKGLSNLETNRADQKLRQKIPGYTPLADRATLPSLGPAKMQ